MSFRKAICGSVFLLAVLLASVAYGQIRSHLRTLPLLFGQMCYPWTWPFISYIRCEVGNNKIP